MTKQYRAIIVRDNGVEEEWGFFDIRLDHGVLILKTDTSNPGFDTLIAPGTWREVRDMYVEVEDPK